MRYVDVRLVEDLALPYVDGAEAALVDPTLDPSLAAAWQALLVAFPGLTLAPLFADQPVAELADLVDAIRLGGAEPPDPFCWYAIACEDAVADEVAAAAAALPMVAAATVRAHVLLASTISYGTNPDANRTLQIQPAPNGVDAIHVWQVAGGTGVGAQLADIEDGWNTNHQELLLARIHAPSGFRPDRVPDGGHGTCVAGILVGGDNGVGTVGIVPDADLTLIADDAVILADAPNAPGLSAASTAAKIAAAAKTVGVGGVILIEEALNLFARPPLPSGDVDERADMLVEFQPAIQIAIRLATLFGVTVIEPAGNGGADLDSFAFLAHTRPGSPTFSFAVVVGAGEQSGISWDRTFSSFGSRVDCFADGARVRAPSSTAQDAYLLFSGTSSASAVVAGAAAAIQAMSLAATGATLAPADVRRLLSDPTLGTAVVSGGKGGIGTMPDLRKISRSQKWARILPAGAAASADNAMVLALIDADDHLVIRHWTSFTLWGTPIVLTAPNAGVELTPCQPSVTSTAETDPVERLVDDVYLMGPLGIHHVFSDSSGQEGDLTTPLAPASVSAFGAAAQGRSVAAVRTAVDTLAVAAVSPAGRLTVLTGDPGDPAGRVSDPLVLSPVGMYRRTPGPAIVSRAPQRADVVAVEDGGSLSWFSGATNATIGTGWVTGPADPSSTEFDPGARAALLAVDDGLLAAAVGTEGWLRVAHLDPDALVFDPPEVVDVQVTISTLGPVALVLAGTKVVVLAVDTDGVLRVASRPAAGGDWSELAAVAAPARLSPLGGVVAVSMPDSGVMAVVVAGDGTVLSALSADGAAWPPLLPLP